MAQSLPVDPAVMSRYEAHATSVSGTVDRVRDQMPWAVSNGEQVPVQQTITTGTDGFARFEVQGGSSFDLLSNSKVVFRENTASAGDLLDVMAGRVRVHLQPGPGQWQQRVFCPLAIVSTHQPSTISVAVDEDNVVRIDVLQGEVRVQHTLLPRSQPVLLKAVDAIVVRPDEQISRRVDRGTLYRYTVGILVALTPGHKNNEPIEGKPLLAQARTPTHVWSRLMW
jgi:ferric-dicitrate binding protein FerR (iron transport regulator)